MIYVDPLCSHGFIFDRRVNSRPVKTCHMFELRNSKEKLLNMASLIGMKSRWIKKSNRGIWHFDLMKGKRQLAIKEGAVEVPRKEAVEIWKNIYWLNI